MRELVAAAAAVDDLVPLSEHVLLRLVAPGEHDLHLLAHEGGELAGYLHLDRTDALSGAVVELVVHPSHRRKGMGTALIRAALDRAGVTPVRLWAHGELNGAHELAGSLGFAKSRELWQMRRSLFAALPRHSCPAGVVVRTFQPGRDEMRWLAANAVAFADHPEQGRLSESDLSLRMAEPWFDPAGFLVAERGDEMVGFHWTKVLPGSGVGEVYVLGVTPELRGSGLGRHLAVRGLERMRDQGLGTAMLYVDADNAPAVAMYESIGFMHWDSDVMFEA